MAKKKLSTTSAPAAQRGSVSESPKALRLRYSSAPRSFPLFSITSRLRRPSRNELDAALLVCETLLQKTAGSNFSASPTLWDHLARLQLPETQESWIRALFMDLAGASPYVADPRHREALFRQYLSRVQKELRSLLRECSARASITPASPFSPLEELFK